MPKVGILDLYILETARYRIHVFEKILDKHIELANSLASGPDQNETNSSVDYETK